MDYSLFLSYMGGAAALVGGVIGTILWLVRYESRRADHLDDFLNEA